MKCSISQSSPLRLMAAFAHLSFPLPPRTADPTSVWVYMSIVLYLYEFSYIKLLYPADDIFPFEASRFNTHTSGALTSLNAPEQCIYVHTTYRIVTVHSVFGSVYSMSYMLCCEWITANDYTIKRLKSNENKYSHSIPSKCLKLCDLVLMISMLGNVWENAEGCTSLACGSSSVIAMWPSVFSVSARQHPMGQIHHQSQSLFNTYNNWPTDRPTKRPKSANQPTAVELGRPWPHPKFISSQNIFIQF